MSNGLPGVSIVVENGALGRVSTTRDGVAGLILVGVSLPLLPLYAPKQIFGLKEAENLGVTPAYDEAQNLDAYRQIKEFYDEAGNGAELWIMTMPVTKTLTEMLDVNTTTNAASKLLDAADGRIRLLGISRYIDAINAYAQVTVAGLDEDVSSCLPKAQGLAIAYRDQFKPLNVFVDGRGWNGSISDLTDLRTYTYSKVSVLLGATNSGKSAAVGLTLGRQAKLPVQRSLARVKDGALNVTAIFLTNGALLNTYSDAQIGQLHSKAYIVPRRYVGRAGFYFTDNPTATIAQDDYLTISNNRVIDKALTIVYSTYINEINDEIEITEEGKLSTTKVAYYRAILLNALNTLMVSEGEASAVAVEIDPEQNVLTTDVVEIEVRITPVGYAKQISVSLGFRNPAA